MENGGDETSMSGLLMKLEGQHRNIMSNRWVWKWVTCSPTEISYYNKSLAPTRGQEPKKTLPTRDCVVRFDKDKRIIVVVGRLSRGNASSGDDGPYTATFKCDNTRIYAKWSKVLCTIANVENGAPRFTEAEAGADCTIDLNDPSMVSAAEYTPPPLPTERRMCGVLSKLEGHRKSFSPLNMSKRWRKKWVTCDVTQLCYYNTASEPKITQQPRKSLLVKDCVLRFYKSRLMVEVEQLPNRGFTHTDPAATYTITLKCGDEHEYDAWSKFLHSVVTARTVDMSSGALGGLAHLLHHHPEIFFIFLLSFFVARKLNSQPPSGSSGGFFPELPHPGDTWDNWDPMHELSRLLPLLQLSRLLPSISRDTLFTMIEPIFTMIGVGFVLRSFFHALMHTPPPKKDRKLKLLSTTRAPISPRRHSDPSITPFYRENAAQQSNLPMSRWVPPGSPIEERTEGEPLSAVKWRDPQDGDMGPDRRDPKPGNRLGDNRKPSGERSPDGHNARRRLYT